MSVKKELQRKHRACPVNNEISHQKKANEEMIFTMMYEIEEIAIRPGATPVLWTAIFSNQGGRGGKQLPIHSLK